MQTIAAGSGVLCAVGGSTVKQWHLKHVCRMHADPQVYQTSEDEGIFECPVGWGSNARVRVSARLKLGPFVFYVPVEVCNLQV